LPYEQWTPLHNNSSFLSSAPYYASTDGLFFVIRNTANEERDLTPEEREQYQCNDFEERMFAGSAGDKKAGPRGPYTGPKEKAVKIEVKKKQE